MSIIENNSINTEYLCTLRNCIKKYLCNTKINYFPYVSCLPVYEV